MISYLSPSAVPAGQTVSLAVGGEGFGSNPTLTVGSQTFTPGPPGTDAGGNETLTVLISVPAAAGGTSLPVTVTSTGEFGNAFDFQPPPGQPVPSPASPPAQLPVLPIP